MGKAVAATLLLLFGSLCLPRTCGAQATETAPSLTKAQWREDLQFFARELEKHHKNAFHLVSKEQLRSAVAALDARIPSLKDYEIVVGLQSLAAMVGDGHTFVATWGVHHFYPLDLCWFGRELRVVRTTPAYAQALGARVTKINGVSIEGVDAKIQSVIPQGENEWYVLNQSAGQVIRAEVLASLGVAPDVRRAAFTFEDDGGRQFTLDISSVAPEAKIDWLSAARETPLYLQRPGERFWFTYLPDSQTVYVNFRGYDSLAQHARQLFEFVDSRSPQRLVIDMRQNGGGNYTLARTHLIYEIQNRSSLNSEGCLFVITGRGTFSAAMTNVTDFRRETEAILVGEPTGARPRGYQENYWLTLPNSRLQVSVASRHYKFSDENMPAVMPDHRVEPTWADYKAGRDPVMQWVLAFKKRK